LITKINQINKFLDKKLKVKVVVRLRGREKVHLNLAYELIEKVVKQTNSICESKTKFNERDVVVFIRR
jgi:translation initiation factor IF-3